MTVINFEWGATTPHCKHERQDYYLSVDMRAEELTASQWWQCMDCSAPVIPAYRWAAN